MDFKYNPYPFFEQSALQLPGQPVYRSLGGEPVTDAYKPLSTLNVPWTSFSEDFTQKQVKKGLHIGIHAGSKTVKEVSRPLKEVPCYLDKTHFSTSSSCTSIFSSLTEILTKLHVDFEVQQIKNKIIGVCHPENIPCSFVVNLFQGQENIIVEFQRRSGCVVQFSKFYAEVLSAMNTDARPQQNAEKELLPVTLDQTTLNNLLRMSTSELVDVQREGLRVLANCLSYEPNKKLLLASSSASFLATILSSSDEEAMRLASVIADALSSVSSKATIAIAESSLRLLSNGNFSSLLGRDTKRHLTHAIAGCTKTHTNHFAQHPNNREYVSCLERCSASADAATRAAAFDALVVF